MSLDHGGIQNSSRASDGASSAPRARLVSMQGGALSQANQQNRGMVSKMSPGLGWLSLGLGISALLFPREVAKKLGLRPTDVSESALRGVGIREIISGIGIL